jgi:hypothetical protein
MATETATIRVPRATRDLLAAQARRRGVSVAALLSDLAGERELAAAYQSERDASRIDSGNQEVWPEEAGWDAAAADGIE